MNMDLFTKAWNITVEDLLWHVNEIKYFFKKYELIHQ